MDVSIIIINYNTREMTSACIDSVIDNTQDIEYEIILVDNASVDGSKEFFKHDKRVKYIFNKYNKGFGAGNNVGAKYAKGKYVFLLNSDTLLKNNAIKIFFDFSEAHPNPCVCGGWLIDRDGNPNVSAIPFPRMSIIEFLRSKFFKKQILNHSRDLEVDAICGADMFLPKKIFDKIGGFDENIFMYGEEIELQFRLRKMNIKSLIIEGPEIVHFGGGSTSSGVSSTHYKSHFYFLKKHMSKFNYICARSYYACNYCIRILLGESNIIMKDVIIKV